MSVSHQAIAAPEHHFPRPNIRNMRERTIQTLAYEAGGLLVVTPLYALAFGTGGADSLKLLFVVSIVCMVWAAIHNTVFDWVEALLCHRVASDRPAHCRLLHALSHETTSILVSTPAIMIVGGHGFWAALVADIGITLAYTVYGCCFHKAFDFLRPVKQD